MSELTQPNLARQLETFDFDGDQVEATFRNRLARENGWSQEFADRVLTEYRRFLYLSAIAGHPCTPSDQVDQAWHLHMVYTDSYWNRLCGEVLQMQLHHGPTKGGAMERAKYAELYAQTLESYRREFGNPPVDIWPDLAQRFSREDQFERVNHRTHYVLTKAAVHRNLTRFAVVCLSIVAAIVFVKSGQEVVVGMMVTAAIFGALIWITNSHPRSPSRSAGSVGASGLIGGAHLLDASHPHHHIDTSDNTGHSGCSSSGCSSGGCSSSSGG